MRSPLRLIGLEFMGKDWDKIGGGGARTSARWEAGGGFTSPGIGERETAWPSFSATGVSAANATCAVCGGRMRGRKRCSCEQPHDHWKPIGKRRNPENEHLSDAPTGSGRAAHLRGQRDWHAAWLAPAYRALRPGGLIKAFGGTRTWHHLASAMEDVGFRVVGLEAWTYGSGFPKSTSIGKQIDKRAGVEREVVGEHRRHGGGSAVSGSMAGPLGTASVLPLTAPATPAARTWEGWGTALKPAWEPVVVGRKP